MSITAKGNLNLTQIFGGLIIAGVGAFAGFHFAPDSKVDRIEQKVIQLETQSAVADAMGSSRARIEEMERQNKLNSERFDKIEAAIRHEPPLPDHVPKTSSSERAREPPTSGATR